MCIHILVLYGYPYRNVAGLDRCSIDVGNYEAYRDGFDMSHVAFEKQELQFGAE